MVDVLQVSLATPDRFEQVRDQIAGILRANFDYQETQDASNAVYVFSERVNPWEQLHERDQTPIINVAAQDVQYDGGITGVVNDQKATARYHVDCIAFAESAQTAEGHSPGDEAASVEAQRVARQCRQILMGPQNAYLQLRGVVWKRWIQSQQVLQPPAGERPVVHVVATRLTLQVEFTESAPEQEASLLEVIDAEITRADDGKILVGAQYDYSEG